MTASGIYGELTLCWLLACTEDKTMNQTYKTMQRVLPSQGYHCSGGQAVRSRKEQSCSVCEVW